MILRPTSKILIGTNMWNLRIRSEVLLELYLNLMRLKQLTVVQNKNDYEFTILFSFPSTRAFYFNFINIYYLLKNLWFSTLFKFFNFP